MKNLFLAACAAFCLSLAWGASSEETCGHVGFLRHAYESGLSPTLNKPWLVRLMEGLTETDVQSCSVAIEPNFSNQALTGTTTMVVRSLVDGLNQFHFRLGNNFTISSATLDGRPVTATFEDSSHARVDFDQVYNTDQTFTLVINYSGISNGGGFGSIVFGTHSGASYCFTLSEPWLAYTWWPNKDDNTDKSVMAIAVTVPNTMMVAANGLLQGTDTLSGNRLRYRYQSVSPMSPYLLCFGATNFNHFTDSLTLNGTTMPLEFFIWPENDNTTNRNAWLGVKTMITTLSPWYGDYPFLNEKYGIYQFSFGGGMEHQTMTGENSFGENLSVHELGHQWWGDFVTCATWSDIWLNEGFATYTEAVWLEKKAGSSGLPALSAAMQARKPTAVNDTVYVYNPTDINRIFSTNFTYRKGGWVLHMLRHVLGDSVFWSGMLNYRSAYALGAATTNQFRDSMAATSGLDLTNFFQEWVYQPGAPQYEYGWTNLTVGGQNYVAAHIKQVQSASYPIFKMPVDFRYTVGTATTKSLTNDAALQNYLIPVSGTATAASLDPDGWILNTGIANVAYVPGPPKVVSSTPLPGATYTGSQRMSVSFHTNVNIAPGDVSIRRVSDGATIPVSTVYNATSFVLGISPWVKLRPGAYEIRIADTVTAVNSGQALDGEIVGSGGAAYPSGDGKPGGALVVPFTVSYN